MLKIPIGIGNCSLTYLYMLGPFLFNLMQDYLLSLDSIKYYLKKNIFGIETVLNNHKLIKLIYIYISYIIFGTLFYYLSIFGEKNNDKVKIQQKDIQKNLIVNEIKKNPIDSKVKIEFYIIFGIFALNKVLRTVVSYYKISELDFWIFNIVFISLFMYKYLRIHIYKHHIYSLGFIFFTNLCLLFIAASFRKSSDKETTFEKHTWKCLFIIIFYIILAVTISFARVDSKKFMDINYLSPYKMIFFIGIFGLFFTLITLIFTSTISCNNSAYCNTKKTNTYFNYTNNINVTYTINTSYLDSIPLYFSDLKNVYKEHNYKYFFIEIFIVIPLYLVSNFGVIAFEMIIILYLNPNYILISDCLYYATIKLIDYVFRGDYATKKFCIEYIAEILSLFGYLIYLEIIELRFCGLDKDLKKNITERSIKESLVQEIDFDINQGIDDDKDDKNSDDEEDENKKAIEMGLMTTTS